MPLRVVELCELADRHPVPHWDSMVVDEALLSRVRYRPLNVSAVDGIGPIQHHDWFTSLRGSFQEIPQRGLVGVKASACILDVENQHIEVPQNIKRGTALGISVAVNAVYVYFRCLILEVGDVRGVNCPGDTVLRAEDRCQLQTWCTRQNVNGPSPVGVH